MKSTTSYTYKDIWLIAYPILISLIMEQMIGITDTAFLGHVGEIELGASAIAGVYYLAIFMIGFGFTVGSQILIARRNGEGNYRAIGNIFYQGIYFLMLMSLVIFILSQVFSEQILGMLVSSDRIVGAATDYIRWRVYGFFFSFIGAMFRAFFVGTTQTRTLTLNSIVMVAANVIFNYTLIFGKFGFPAMGIAGAAIGSSLAELVSVLFFISYTYRKIDYRKYGLNRILGIRTKALSQIMHISLWTMIQKLYITVYMVPVLHIYRTSGRTSARHFQYHTKCIEHTVYDGHGFRINLQFTGKQPDWCRTQQRSSGINQPTYTPMFFLCHSTDRTYRVVPLDSLAYIYQYTRLDNSKYSYFMGIMFYLYRQYSRLYLFSVGIRNG